MKRGWMVLALFAGVACSTNGGVNRLLDREVVGKVVLESYTVELTWGYKLSGLYIDNDGVVWIYQHDGTPWYPDKLKPGELSARDMLTKHKNARQVGTVDPNLLRDLTPMIKPAARGTVTRPAGSAAAGGSLEVAYLFDPKTSVYREIVLAGQGDRIATNSAPEAQMLLDYLREVKEMVGAGPPS